MTWITIFLLLGLGLTIGGYKIIFTVEGLDWMYKQGIWKNTHTLSRNDVDGRNFDRFYGGGGILAVGLIFLGTSLVGIILSVFYPNGL